MDGQTGAKKNGKEAQVIFAFFLINAIAGTPFFSENAKTPFSFLIRAISHASPGFIKILEIEPR